MIRGILNKIKIVLDHNKSSEMIGFDGLFEAYEQLEQSFGLRKFSRRAEAPECNVMH